MISTAPRLNAYTPAIGQAIGIEGSQQGAPNFTTLQAVLTLTLIGNAVLTGWGWGGQSAFLDLPQIQADRSDGKGFTDFIHNTTPNYTDTTPFPSTLTKWTYRAIYHVNDARTGQWSNPVSVAVRG